MAEKITFINSRGQSLELKNSAPFILSSVDGKGDVHANIQLSKAPYQDGSTHIDSVFDERLLSLQIAIMGNTNDLLLERRQYVASVFNSKLGAGKLIYENGNTKREIKAVPDGVPVFPTGTDNKGINFQKGLVNLICPSPFWLDIMTENIKLEDFVAHFRFSFHFPVRFASRGDSRILINKGDVPTPIIVEFRGAAVNPKITNLSTGEFIRVNRTIPEGYKLILETTFGNKKVEIVAPDGVSQNGFPWIDPDSDFFSLDMGENKFSFITDSGRPEVYVSYKNRYLSV
ncbi:phage tail family protein [Viridibacillus sp. FSL R5-0477]|uniref:Phage-related tail protein n=1 Tax=Viridibacillus arenosi FSL R5-213 TaxID=1227360 RepID=W4EV97_9BACL|nr:phage tail family protein [Viridibacillus arenosi]ETT84169.1 phage-related tail protein [Viridibacillus arenosi FSL R5-213]OMC90035.1 phage tail protein [Viridibacillus arenosi]